MLRFRYGGDCDVPDFIFFVQKKSNGVNDSVRITLVALFFLLKNSSLQVGRIHEEKSASNQLESEIKKRRFGKLSHHA